MATGRVDKGIICRVCIHIDEQGKCKLNYTEPVSRKDECWRYQNKGVSLAFAEASTIDISGSS